MPRKYHRPPDTTTKRRKTRRSTVPYEFEAPPPDAVVADDELSDEVDSELPATQTIRTTSSDGLSPKGERHVNVDYSYVRGDVFRIAAIMSFLVIALAITSIFR